MQIREIKLIGAVHTSNLDLHICGLHLFGFDLDPNESGYHLARSILHLCGLD